MAKAVRRTVQVRAYADRIVVRCQGEVVAEHQRFFGRDRTIYDPWHYLPVLVTKAVRMRFPWLRHVFADGGYPYPKERPCTRPICKNRVLLWCSQPAISWRPLAQDAAMRHMLR